MTALDPDHPNPIEQKSDRELVRSADPYSNMEMFRRLKTSISEQTASLLASQKTTNDLTASIKTLTVVLVVLTVLIALLTVIMVWPTLAGWFAKGGGVMTAGALSLLGLVFDIAGATVLVFGVLKRDMTVFKALGDDNAAEPLYRRIPLKIARRFGSRDVRNTTPDLLGEFASTFYGLLLLVLGFALQVIGQWYSMRGKS
jgi:hypothetical protein